MKSKAYDQFRAQHQKRVDTRKAKVKPTREQERDAVEAKQANLAAFVDWMKGWSAGAGGGMLPMPASDTMVTGFEHGAAARHSASAVKREAMGITREELGAYLARQ